MVIWMQHEQHGKHPAQSAEVEAMKKNGWTLCPPKVRAVAKPEPQAFAAAEATVTPAESAAFNAAKLKADEEAASAKVRPFKKQAEKFDSSTI